LVVFCGAGELDYQDGRFGYRNLPSGVPKKELAGGFHSIDAGAHDHAVKVHLEDFLFGKPPFKLQSPPEFDKLSPKAYVRSVRVEGSRKLLGSRGPSS